MEPHAQTVVIGRLGRPHGIAGAMHSRGSGPTLATVAVGETLELRPRGAAPLRLVLAARSGMPDQPILHFAGIESRDAASALSGAELAIAADRVEVPDDPDTFLVRDLVGCEVLLGDRPLGRVRDVIAAPANDVLEVEADGGPLLLPFTADALLDLDVPARRIVVRPDLLGDAG